MKSLRQLNDIYDNAGFLRDYKFIRITFVGTLLHILTKSINKSQYLEINRVFLDQLTKYKQKRSTTKIYADITV